MSRFPYRTTLLAATALTFALPHTCWAQPVEPSDDIIVTARKRDETSLSVPVVLTAVTGAQLERAAIVKLDDVTKLVPQLQMGSIGGSSNGGTYAIRGFGGGENNHFQDQAVSFNVDGVQVSKPHIRRLAQMDIGQLEVLKGPQALFFGKNSPAGVISIRSADPTSTFEAKASGAYEFNAREWRGDGFISGPITDTLGARIAVVGTTMRGWFRNEAGSSNSFAALADDRSPKTKEFAIRGTLKWEPSDRFDALLKVSYNTLTDNGPLSSGELANCPYGTPQLGGPENCRLDGRGLRIAPGMFLHTIAPDYPADGKPFLRQNQILISYEMNHDITDSLKLTSVTGYWRFRQRMAEVFNPTLDQTRVLTSANHLGNNDFSEELRLASSYDGPVNFLIGGYFQATSAFTGSNTFIGLEPVNGVNPRQNNNTYAEQRGRSFSGFGQVSLKPTDELEVSAGGRWSYERKRVPLIMSQLGAGPGPRPIVTIPPDPAVPRSDSWTNFSPEITVSYRPTDRLTVFGSYKEGFLSGGFNAFGGAQLSFDQQVIKGFEGGAKAELFDRTLRVNLAAYHYVITGLQVVQQTLAETTIRNAGKATLKGIEGDFVYRTPLEGLSIRGGVGYNDAKYNDFNASCYIGQTQEEGCNFGLPTATTVINGQTYTTFALQDLSGHPIYRAPKWSGNVGASFERDIGSTLRFGLDGNMSFSSSYGNVTDNPNARQSAFQLIDASARIGAQDDSWELALIGNNLTNKFYGVRYNDNLLTGTGSGRAANDPRGRLLADQITFVNRGRQIMLRATIRYGR